MTELAPLLRRLDLIAGLDLALKLRAAGRPRRQAASRKGWATRRDSGRLPKGEDPSGASCEASQSGPPKSGHRPNTAQVIEIKSPPKKEAA